MKYFSSIERATRMKALAKPWTDPVQLFGMRSFATERRGSMTQPRPNTKPTSVGSMQNIKVKRSLKTKDCAGLSKLNSSLTNHRKRLLDAWKPGTSGKSLTFQKRVSIATSGACTAERLKRSSEKERDEEGNAWIKEPWTVERSSTKDPSISTIEWESAMLSLTSSCREKAGTGLYSSLLIENSGFLFWNLFTKLVFPLYIGRRPRSNSATPNGKLGQLTTICFLLNTRS